MVFSNLKLYSVQSNLTVLSYQVAMVPSFSRFSVPGQRVQLENISWTDAILAELGEHRGTRIAYSEGILEIMARCQSMNREGVHWWLC